jgi:holin-like protein
VSASNPSPRKPARTTAKASATPPAPPAAPAFLPGFIMLMAWWLAGEALVHLLGLSLPGPVAGMLLLLGFSLLRKHLHPTVSAASHSLLSHLPLLFVPAGVGIMEHAQLLGTLGLPMLITLVLSAAITLSVTALTLQYLRKRRESKE